MAVSFRTRDILSSDEKVSLQLVLGTTTAADFELALTNLAKAAIREFADVMLGQYSPRSAADVNERRLLRMVQHYFAGKIPKELAFTGIFRITDAQATTVLRNMTAKNRADLISAYKDTLQALFDMKTPYIEDGYHEVTLVSKHLVEWLKAESSRVAPSYDKIYRIRGSNDRYAIPLDTYNALCLDFNLTP